MSDESSDPVAEFFSRIEAEHGSAHEALRERGAIHEFAQGGSGLLTPHVGHVHIALASDKWVFAFYGEPDPDWTLYLPSPLEIPDA